MIKLKHLELYRFYGGDGDALIRIGSEEDKKYMPYEIWSILNNLIQDISLIKSNITSKSYIEEVNSKLKKVCENQQVIDELLKMG